MSRNIIKTRRSSFHERVFSDVTTELT